MKIEILDENRNDCQNQLGHTLKHPIDWIGLFRFFWNWHTVDFESTFKCANHSIFIRPIVSDLEKKLVLFLPIIYSIGAIFRSGFILGHRMVSFFI